MPLEITYCPGSLKEGFASYSGAVLKRMFDGRKVSHILPFFSSETRNFDRQKFMENRKRISISGVQEKLSLLLDKNKLRLTEEGEQGQYILKPIPHDLMNEKQVPANEHLTMQIARQVYKIPVAENALIFFKDDTPAYITRRFDIKPGGGKYLQEDFASVAGKTAGNSGPEFKYEASYLDVGQLIKKHIAAAEVELEKLFRLVLFNYVFSNGDAHLKNFSLIESPDGDMIMSPAYDLLCTRLHVKDSDMALKSSLSDESFDHPSFSALGFYAYDDFLDFGLALGLKEIRIRRTLELMRTEQSSVHTLIACSYLDQGSKELYTNCYRSRLMRLNNSFEKRM